MVAIDAGRLTADSPFLSVAPADDLGVRGTRHVFAILEPVDDVPGVEVAAREVLDLMHDELARRGGQSPTAAILGAVEAANAWLCTANVDRPLAHRLRFGLTLILARDDDLYLAQVPPSQVLIGQEGELYAFPGLETWRGRRRLAEEAQPLGLFPEIEPELYHTRIERGDLITLVSTSLARVIDLAPQEVFVAGDAGAVADHLLGLAQTFALSDGYGAAIAVTGAEAGARPSAEISFLRRAASMFSHLLPEETAERLQSRARRSREALDRRASAVHTGGTPEDGPDIDSGDAAPAGPVGGADTARRFPPARHDEPLVVGFPGHDPDGVYWEPHAEHGGADDAPEAAWPDDGAFADPVDDGDHGEGRRTLTELLAGAVLALSAAVVGVWQLTVNRDRPIEQPRDDGTLGLPRLGRYEDRPRLPDFTGIRARLPRAPVGRLTGVVALVLIVCLTGALIFSVHNSRVRAREAKIEQLFQEAVAQRQQALEQTSPLAAQAYLEAAEARIRQAQAAGLDAVRAEQELAAIATTRDQALGIDRLANIQVLGGVPAAPEGVSPRIFFGNGQLYVFTDALYRLDTDGTKLIRLLGPDDLVGGEPVGTLLGAAWGDGSPIAFSGTAAYLFDPATATWSRQPLGTFGTAYAGIVQSNGYGGNLYLLSPSSGQILKFASGAFAQQPEDWTGGLAAEDLTQATDMEIDGRIYVLLADGRVLDFYRSALEHTYTPTVTPAIHDAVALSAQPGRPYMYVADGEGRILRLTRDGAVVQQFMAGAGAPSLANIRDIAVDDILGVAYVLTDQALLQVHLPPPPAR
ncbi:MAG: hypothetical protein QJR03_01245 [Sphaerobacter sp.]|nr:hypothetical protein [Sphaerobacter sp.]